MLDMRVLREKPDYVRERLKTRIPELSLLVDKVLKVDSERRRLETELQRLSAERNQLSKEIGILRSKKESSAEEESKVLGVGEGIASLNEPVAAVDEWQRKVMLGIPNLPHPGAPIGANSDSNPEVRVWGDKPGFNFQPIDHVELNARLGLFDPVRAAKISGAGYVCFTNLGARLQRGLIQFLLDLHTSQHGYVEICPPYIVRLECMVGTV